MPPESGLGVGRPTRYIVTGAAGTIGCKVVEQLSKAGYEVVAVDRRSLSASSIGASTFAKVDLTDPAEVSQFVRTLASGGPISGAILVHGGASRSEVESHPLGVDHAVFVETLQKNLVATYLVVVGLAKVMACAHGDTAPIVIASSINANSSLGYPSYSAAKAGVESLVSTLSPSLARRGIRINAVALGTVWDADAGSLHDADPSHFDDMRRLSPLGAVMTPAQAAEVLIQVCTSLAPMYGTTIRVDYGQASWGWRPPADEGAYRTPRIGGE